MAEKNGPLEGSTKRSRPTSSNSSSSSVSTISTNLSRSPLSSSKLPEAQKGTAPSDLARPGKRRRRSTTSSSTYSSNSSVHWRRGDRSRDDDRNIRRRRSSVSPDVRGRDRSQDKLINKGGFDDRNQRRNYKSSSSSYSSDTSFEKKSRSRIQDNGGKKTRFRSSISPDSRGRDRNFFSKRSNRRTRSRSHSRDRSRVARNRRSMTPGAARQISKSSEFSMSKDPGSQSFDDDNDRYRTRFKNSERDGNRASRSVKFPKHQPKERSLSPFSKRLALTQAMNIG